MKPTLFFASSDVVVVGRNYEMCDFDNPQGNIYGYASFVVAEDAEGNRVRRHVKTVGSTYVGSEAEALAPAERMAKALNVRLQNLGKLPVGFDQWEETFPAYGSDAFIASQESGEVAEWERRVEEDR